MKLPHNLLLIAALFVTLVAYSSSSTANSISPKKAAPETPPTADTQQPIEIQADRLQASEKQGKSIYTGNVKVSQGSLNIKGDRIEVIHPNGKLQKVITTGKPATFKRFNKIENAWVIGQANKIEYDSEAKTVLLVGNAQIEQPGKHQIKGSQLFYDMTRQTLQANSDASQGDKQRVTVTFSPQEPAQKTPEDTASDANEPKP